MAEEHKGDWIWLVLTTCTSGAMDVTLNKYSSYLAWYVVLGLWCIPAGFFLAWLWRVPKARARATQYFLQHPVFYILMFTIFIALGWPATRTLISLFSGSSPATAKLTSQRDAQIIPVPSPNPSLTQTPAAPKILTRKKATSDHSTSQTTVPSKFPPLTTYEQKCEGSACAQGPNAQATYNQNGAPKLLMTETQKEAIPDAMKPQLCGGTSAR